MKKFIIILAFTNTLSLLAQNVGINTTSPSKTLDINGELRIQTLPDANADATANKELVVNAAGDVKTTDRNTIGAILLQDNKPNTTGKTWNSTATANTDGNVTNTLYSTTITTTKPNQLVNVVMMMPYQIFDFGTTTALPHDPSTRCITASLAINCGTAGADVIVAAHTDFFSGGFNLTLPYYFTISGTIKIPTAGIYTLKSLINLKSKGTGDFKIDFTGTGENGYILARSCN
ncbi:hypothetical protein ABF179_001321 [Flavobacterium psychrophilum]|jgi:hypothetical protein|uniref:C1q domain-containing protein n=1 Tax=Flavobacterium psychrophilum TaxID=96345 RepID=A0A7U2RBG0_FLAPS|nr:hypothetical protein [Flavobacterium psychrophilum]EKT4550162.1 hypothetical protein [Flavobacterium psychrophilum]ELI6453858.1 hypothetical protein [Flavobacterium psychrophilum]QRE04472.1 hypothetical protein H0H26_02385 [Flavobacterium psychrophilum]